MAAPRSGMSGQVGYKTESVVGTGVTVDRFLPFVSESLTDQLERLESEGIVAGRRILDTEQWNGGNRTIGGDVGHELYQQGTALLWSHILGANTTTGSGPYTHTARIGDLTGKSFTTQIGKPGTGGTVHPFTFTGCKVASWELAVAQGAIATLGLTLIAMGATTGTALAAATFGAGALQPFKFNHGAISLGGSAVKVKQATVSGDNHLADDRRFIGQTTIDEPLEVDYREITGSLEVEFQNLTQYNHYVAGDELELILAFTSGANSCTLTANIRLDGETPQVGDKGIVPQNLPFKVIGNGSDASAISVVTVNGNSTA
jgi:hypothetical protein